MNVVVTDSNIHIEDSAFVSKTEFQPILLNISLKYPDNEVVKKRFMYSAACEWCVHNFLYNHNYEVERTKDVDINLIPWYARIAYGVLGPIAYLFIK